MTASDKNVSGAPSDAESAARESSDAIRWPLEAPASCREAPSHSDLMSDPSLSELQRLQSQLADLETAIQVRQREEIKVLVDGFAKKLDSLGLSIETATEELRAYLPKRTGRASRAAKRSAPGEFVLYANPADRKQTWGGVGRRPAWVTEFLSKGGDLEKLKV